MDYEVVWSGGEGLTSYTGNSALTPTSTVRVETVENGDSANIPNTTPSRFRPLTRRDRKDMAALYRRALR